MDRKGKQDGNRRWEAIHTMLTINSLRRTFKSFPVRRKSNGFRASCMQKARIHTSLSETIFVYSMALAV